MWDPTEGQGQQKPHLAERRAAVQALEGWPEPGGQGSADGGPSRARARSTTCFGPVLASGSALTARWAVSWQTPAGVSRHGSAVLTASVAQAASGAGMRTGAPAACGAGTGPTASAEAVGCLSPSPMPTCPALLEASAPGLSCPRAVGPTSPGPVSCPPPPSPLPRPPVQQLWTESCLPPRSHRDPCGLCLAPGGPCRSPRGARTDRCVSSVAGQGTQSPVNRSTGTPGQPSPGECAGSQARAGPPRSVGRGIVRPTPSADPTISTSGPDHPSPRLYAWRAGPLRLRAQGQGLPLHPDGPGRGSP